MTASTHAKAGEYRLTSELAQFCLPAAQRDRNQKVAWLDSICLIYLIIGVVGLKPPLPVIRQVPPIEEPVIQVIEQVQQEVQPQEVPRDQPEEPRDDTADSPVVMVTLETPTTEFSVPTIGTLLGSASMATAPPLNPMSSPVQTLKSNQVFRINLTGRGGNYPQPDKPVWAVSANMRGTIIMLISVDTAGAITDVQLEKSTGYPRLDAHTVNHVKRRFSFEPSDLARQYRLPVEYQ